MIPQLAGSPVAGPIAWIRGSVIGDDAMLDGPFAPSATSGSSAARVRFQTPTRRPHASSRSAKPLPIAPAPTIPTPLIRRHLTDTPAAPSPHAPPAVAPDRLRPPDASPARPSSSESPMTKLSLLR
jgi:hypothetical protein